MTIAKYIVLYCHKEYWRVKSVIGLESKRLTLEKVESLKNGGHNIMYVCNILNAKNMFELGTMMGDYSQDLQERIYAILDKD